MKIVNRLRLAITWILLSIHLFSQTIYKIESVGQGTVLDLDGYNAVNWWYYAGHYQHWTIEPSPLGHIIRNVENGKVLDLNGYHAVNWWYYNGPYQQWNIQDAGDGSYIIQNIGTGKVLDIDGYFAVNW